MPTVTALDYFQKQPAISEVTAIVGDERFLQIEALEMLKQAIEKKHGMYELASFTSKQTDIAQVLDEVRSGSLFSNKRLVVLDIHTKFFDKKETKEAVQKYLEKPSKSGFLVIIIPKINKNTTLHKAINKNGLRVDCDPLKAYKLSEFVRIRAKNYGLKFETDALDFLVECVGGAVGPAASELDKLSVYLGDKKTISKSDIEDVLGYKGISNVWQLMDSMIAGNTTETSKQAYILMESGEEPAALIPLVIGQIKNLWIAVSSHREGQTSDNAMKIASIPPFKWNEWRKFVESYDTSLCNKLHQKLLKADLDVKLSNVPNQFIFENLVLSIAREIQMFRNKQRKTRKLIKRR